MSLNGLLKLAVTSSNWFLLKLAVTSSNWFFLVENGCD